MVKTCLSCSLPSPPLKKKQERTCLVSQDPKPSPK
jgi:hypothetical protein